MPEITREKLQNMHRYFVEYSVFLLLAAVVFLTFLYIRLDNDFRDFLKTDNARNIQIIQDNTNALKQISK